MLATLRSIFTAPSSNFQYPTYFHKSRAFVAPDPSALPPLETFFSPTKSVRDNTDFYLHREVIIPDDKNIHTVEGRWVGPNGGLPRKASESVIIQGQREPFQIQPLSADPAHPSDLSTKSSSACDHYARVAISHTPSLIDHRCGDYSPSPPRSITHTTVDVVSLRLSGEIVTNTSRNMVVSEKALRRIKAVASWIARYVYALTPEGRSCGGLMGTYNIDVHERATRKILQVLESTCLPPPTVFLALWYITQFPFSISAADGLCSRDVFYRLLCGYGTVCTEDTVFRAFMAGLMLANKTNEDFPLTTREWNEMPLDGIDDPNFLELCALKALDWNIAIDVVRWNLWIGDITAYHTMMASNLNRAVSSEYPMLVGVIDRVTRQDPHWDCQCSGGDTFDSSSRSFATDVLSQSLVYPQLKSDQPLFPLRHHSTLRNATINHPLGEPIPWCPSSDPILGERKPPRTMGMAPGTWATMQPITVLEDAISGHRPLLPALRRRCSVEDVNRGLFNPHREVRV